MSFSRELPRPTETEPSTKSGEDFSERLRNVVDDCLRRRAAGEHLPDEVIIAANPVLMPALGDELRKLRLIAAACDRAQQTAGLGPDTVPGHDSGISSSSGNLEVRCPSCHTPTDVAVDTPLTDLTCSSCGSHFSLIDKSKTSRMATALTSLGRFELIERVG